MGYYPLGCNRARTTPQSRGHWSPFKDTEDCAPLHARLFGGLAFGGSTWGSTSERYHPTIEREPRHSPGRGYWKPFEDTEVSAPLYSRPFGEVPLLGGVSEGLLPEEVLPSRLQPSENHATVAWALEPFRGHRGLRAAPPKALRIRALLRASPEGTLKPEP